MPFILNINFLFFNEHLCCLLFIGMKQLALLDNGERRGEKRITIGFEFYRFRNRCAYNYLPIHARARTHALSILRFLSISQMKALSDNRNLHHIRYRHECGSPAAQRKTTSYL